MQVKCNLSYLTYPSNRWTCVVQHSSVFRHGKSTYKDRQSCSTCPEDYKILGILQVEQQMKSLPDNLLPGDKSRPLKNLKLSGGYCWGYAEHVSLRKLLKASVPGWPIVVVSRIRLTGRPSMMKRRRPIRLREGSRRRPTL